MKYLGLIFIFFSCKLIAQSFAPAPNELGTTAIYKDSSIFVAWASSIDLTRGFLDISDKSLGFVSYGNPEKALYKAEGNSMDVVSLGDSGIAILTFEYPIFNGDGFDFAVFENAFNDHLLELAFVEVSSDGIYFARFPATSEIPLSPQLTGFEYSNCGYVSNLAGKYRQGYGTPFDLSEIVDPQVDINNITHIKLVDVIGSTDIDIGSFDFQNQLINDPYPTPFESGGFDLDGVGVIHLKNPASAKQLQNNNYSIFISDEKLSILKLNDSCEYRIFDLFGKQKMEGTLEKSGNISIIDLSQGIYYLELDQLVKIKFYK
jgi:hypothetical protein